MPNATGVLKINPLKTVEKFTRPITSAFGKLDKTHKAAVIGGGAALAGAGALAGGAMHGNTTINKIAEDAFHDELNKLANEKSLKKLVSKINKSHPEVFKGIGKKK